MKTSVLNLSCTKLGTAIALSVVSLFATNQTALSSEMLDMVAAKLERDGQIIVDGDPLGTIYTIRGMGLTFAGASCPINGTCSYMMSRGGWVYDQELNAALANACYDQNNYSVICNLGN